MAVLLARKLLYVKSNLILLSKHQAHSFNNERKVKELSITAVGFTQASKSSNKKMKEEDYQDEKSFIDSSSSTYHGR